MRYAASQGCSATWQGPAGSVAASSADAIAARIDAEILHNRAIHERDCVNLNPATEILVIGGRPGVPFSISPWERSAEALRFWTTGEWDRAIDVLKAQLEADSGNANVLYNLACAESRGGYVEAAIYHVQEAIQREPRFARMCQTDADLDAIRSDERFPGPPD